MKKILVLGTMDTKGEQIWYLRERILAQGCEPMLMDLSTGRSHSWEVQISADEVARAAGQDIKALRETRDRGVASQLIRKGAEEIVSRLFSEKTFQCIVGFGGVTLANIASSIMQKLPFGFPKALGVTAVIPALTARWFDATDILVFQMVVEIAGMNDLLKSAIDRFAGVICGMVYQTRPYEALQLPYPAVAITEYGFSQRCAERVRQLLEEKGFSVFSFSANGVGDRAMEKLISQGFFDGVIDIVPSGLSDELTGGRRAAGIERLDAAAERGIPRVLAPAGINMTGCGPTRPRDREKYNSRDRILKMDEERWMTRYTSDELKEHAKVYAEKLNRSKGPTVFVFPLRGWSAADMEGSILYSPEEDRVFIDEIKRLLKSEIVVKEVDVNLEDPEFAKVLVECFLEVFASRKKGG